MNYPINNHQIWNMAERQQYRAAHTANTPKVNCDMGRNRYYVPPLMQTHPVTGIGNSKKFTTQPHVSPNIQPALKTTNQTSLTFNRNGSMSEASVYQRAASHAVNRIAPSAFTTDASLNTRRSCNLSVGVSKLSVQDNEVCIPRSTYNSRNNKVTEFTVPGNANRIQPQNQSSENTANSSYNFKIFGSTENEKIFAFTGTVERVIKWNKIFRNHFCYYEVIGSVISIQPGTVNTQKIMLLRDKKGPILQVVYYLNTHIHIEDFYVEQVLRCVGTMSTPNILNAISIRTATEEEIEILQRLCLVCDHAISHFLTSG